MPGQETATETAAALLFRQVAQHQFGHMREALLQRPWPHQIAPENRRQRMVVGQVKVPQGGDRNVQLHRIDTAPEHGGALAIAVIRALYPGATPAEAADIIVPP